MIRIAALQPSKWMDYRRLRLEALKTEPAAFGSSYEEEARLTEEVWRSRMSNCIFALWEREPVGVVSVVFSDRKKTRHIAHIFGFYVAPRHRDRGVGKSLMAAALASAGAKRGIRKVSLSVNPAFRPALSIYQKAGFRVVGKAEEELRVGRHYHDMLNMELRLR